MQALLTSTQRSVAYRATEVTTGRAVTVRMHRATAPTPLELAQVRYAFEVGTELASLSGAVEHVGLVETGADLALVTAEVGPSLDSIVEAGGGPASIEEVLRLGLRIASALAEVHDRGIVHNRLRPSNVFVGDEVVQLADFADASHLRTERPAADDILRRDVDLRYVSPEQTGRMNRSVDSRSDLYALGVILYELIEGSTPFADGDPAALVHAHIARPVPGLRRGGVPPLLGAILARLLAKDAEDRYQEARGLAHDLRRCLEALAEGAVPNFRLGERDISEQLRIPEALYGRAEELLVLDRVVGGLGSGERGLLLVAGYSGVGKSRLVAELEPRMVACDGWFVAGKFDAFRRDVPYLAWVSAMREAVRQALTLPASKLAQFRAELEAALAGNGAAVTAVIPELATLIGEQAELPDVPPGDAQARFTQTFRSVLRTFAAPEHPLVVFLDDLQWADLASLKLLEAVLTDPGGSSILVVAAWRENELGADHPLAASLLRITDAGVRPTRIDLQPLAAPEVHRMLSDTLAAAAAETEALAALVYAKTGGNPFFLWRFVAELVRDGSLAFARAEGRWTWDLAAIEARRITENVAELMAIRIAELPDPTRDALKVASCIGSVFSLADVAAARDDASGIALALAPALDEGLLLPSDMAYRYATNLEAGSADEAAAIDPQYAFLHDRVREAAHASMSSGERAAVHLRIARMRLRAAPADVSDEDVVDVSSHLLQGIELVTAPEERLRLAEVLLRGTRRARGSMAFDTAEAFATAGIGLLPVDAWDAHYGLTIALFTEAAEVAYIQERFAAAEEIGAAVLEHAHTVLERVPIHNLRIGIGVARAQYQEATLYAIRVLDEDFGITLPRNPTKLHVLVGVVRLRAALRGRTTEQLLDLPPMRDPAAEAAMAILMKAATNAYWALPNLVPLIAFRMIRLTLSKGSTGLSAYGYALYGMIATAILRQVDTGYAFGELSMRLLERLGDRQLAGRTGLLWHGFIRHARDPLRLCAADVLDSYHAAMDSGDVENAAYCGAVAYYTDLLAGRPLVWLQERYAPYVTAVLESDQAQTIYALQVWIQAVANLAAGGPGASVLTGEHIDFEAHLAELLRDEKGNAIPQGVSGAGWLAFMLDDMERAERHLAMLWDYRNEAPGQTFLVPCLALYAAVLERRRHRGRMTPGDRLRLARVRRYVTSRAQSNPHDIAPFVAFMDAERDASTANADGVFLHAAEVANGAGIIYLEALAMERAAEVLDVQSHPAVAAHVRTDASRVWRHYGAGTRHDRLGRGAKPGRGSVQDASATIPLGDLDVRTLLDTTRAVSGEIRLEALIERVMTLALQNAGARHGALVLIDDGVPATVATATVDEAGTIVVEAAGRDADLGRPASVVEYVLRAREPVVLDDAVGDRVFGRDAYIARHRVLSVLCAPLMRGGVLVGALYLDNNLGGGVFAEEHLAIVQTIGGQAAVSVENARLFEEQRAQAEAFSRFVPRPFLERLGRRRVAEVRLGDAVSSELVVLFSDLRGFTRMSERLTAQESFELLNAYLARMEPIIHEHGGFIDKFVGDAVMALFIDEPGGAVAAGVQMHRALAQFNLERDGQTPLAMGVGLHSGSVMLGTIGGLNRMETTVIGDTVNTASRLESMTKHYGTPMLLSSTVRDRLAAGPHPELRLVGRVRMVGKSESIDIHEALDARTAAESASLRASAALFDSAMAEWFRGEFAAAAEGFARCLEATPSDAVAARYLGMCEELAGRPAPAAWDGIDDMLEK